MQLVPRLERFHPLRWRRPAISALLLSTAIVGGVTVVAKATALLKDILIAKYLGVGDALDAFLIAFLIPSFIISVVIDPIGPALIPRYLRSNRNGEATLFYGEVSFVAVVAGIAAALCVAAFAPALIPGLAPSFSAEKTDLTIHLLWILSPAIVISGISRPWAFLLQAQKRFVASTTAPIAVTIAIVVALLLVPSMGVSALAVGTLFGFAAEAALLFTWANSCRTPLGWRRPKNMLQIRPFMRQYAPMIFGSLLMSGTLMVDYVMTASLGSGSVSMLSFGSKTAALVLGVGALALGTTTLPHFSHLVANGAWTSVRKTMRTIAIWTFILSTPVVVATVLFSDNIISVMFERGQFDPSHTKSIAFIQSMYILQVPFYLLSIAGVRLLSALALNQILLLISALNLIINIIGNVVFSRLLGVAGIALSTSLVYLISLCLILFFIRRALAKNDWKQEDYLHAPTSR